MSKEQAISDMQNAILRYIESRIPKDLNKAKVGIIDGGKVHLTNGRTMPAEPITNMFYTSGSKVACLVPDGSNTAAIVGVY